MLKEAIKKAMPGTLLRRYEHELRKETHINRALRPFRQPTTYVEIGVRDGECIRQIDATRKIAVDPAPVDPANIARDGTRVVENTSDQFFAGMAHSLLGGRPVNVALADGLHEFRQTLRDILNLERYMARGGVVFVHDCNPPSRKHADDMNGPWNGDVWKIGEYFRRHRPDLNFFTLDCDWGLGVVTNFSRSPRAADSADIEKVAALDYSVLEAERRSILNLRSPLFGTRFFLTRRAGEG